MAANDFTPDELASEEWRSVPIDGWDRYEVSSLGRLRHEIGRKRHRWLRGSVSPKGYLNYSIGASAAKRTARAGRLVMLAFVGFDERTVNHKDGDKLNNRLTNLEYMTQAENVAHAIANGLKKYAPPENRRGGSRGERNGTAKMTENDVRAIRNRRESGEQYKSIASTYNVTPQAIYLIAKRKNWAHV